MTIRQGTENDVVKVSRLWLKMAQELSPNDTPNVEWWRKNTINYFKSGIYYLFVADLGGKIVGFGDFLILPEPSTGKIHMMGRHIFIDPEHRDTDTAGKIYKHSMALAKQKGASVFTMNCADDERDFWEKKQFRCVMHEMRKEI